MTKGNLPAYDGRWRRGAPLIRSEDAGRAVPRHTIWLDGPAASATQVGVRGYSYEPFEQREAFATDGYVLVLYVAGRTLIRRTIGQVEEACEVGPGDISLHAPSVVSRWGWCSPIKVLHVYIEPSYVREIVRGATATPCTVHLRHGVRVTDGELAQMGAELIRELTPPRPLWSERASLALGARIVVHMLRKHFDVERNDERERTFTPLEVASLRTWIAAHLGEPVHVERMANQVHLGLHHFSRVFRSTFGQSPHDYLREQRLKRAHELLLSSDDGVSSIAQCTGFADQSHLTRCFKRHFGVPPGTLRRRGSASANGACA